MRKIASFSDKSIEKTVHDILRSRARSQIYIYLLKKSCAKTEQIIKGTRLHPSTVRETLSEMYDQKLIFREKIKNGVIGKNPFMYYPISPIELLKKHASDMEKRLNRLVNLTYSKNKTNNCSCVKIDIQETRNKI